MMLAEFHLIEHINDHPWPGWQVELFGVRVTLMSSGIAAMILVGVALLALILPAAWRKKGLPHGWRNVIEVMVVFVRDMIARPALHDKAYEFLPFLLTLFVFILGMNLISIFPLEPIFIALKLPPVGVRPTGIATVAAALGSTSLLLIIFLGLRKQARRFRERHRWPWALCVVLSPLLWLKSLSPSVPGVTGKILTVPLAALELVGAVMKCFALVVRLFANMISGHALMAVLMMFILQALTAFVRERTVSLFYIGPACIAAGVWVDLMEILVAGLQAYIFTFLTAMFLAMYAEAEH